MPMATKVNSADRTSEVEWVLSPSLAPWSVISPRTRTVTYPVAVLATSLSDDGDGVLYRALTDVTVVNAGGLRTQTAIMRDGGGLLT